MDTSNWLALSKLSKLFECLYSWIYFSKTVNLIGVMTPAWSYDHIKYIMWKKVYKRKKKSNEKCKEIIIVEATRA